MKNTNTWQTKDRVKVIVCGGKYSGKTVFNEVLRNVLDKDRFALIEAAPDGEWNTGRSSLANPETVKQIRKKGKFSSGFINQVCEHIDNSTSDITLIDVWGVISPENREIFSHASHVVILSSDPDVNADWIKLTEETGCTLLAVLDSSLSWEDEIYDDQGDGVLRWRITQLERIKVPYDSQTAKVLADRIINIAPYTNAGIEDSDADLLGYEEYRNITQWTSAELLALLDTNRAMHGRKQSLNLRGNVQKWGIPYYVLSCDQRDDVSYYDPKTRQWYVWLPTLNLEDEPSDHLNRTIRQTDSHVIVEFAIPEYVISVDQLPDIILPNISDIGQKGIIVSGKGPRRLTGTILKNYLHQTDCARVATTNPRLTSPEIQIEGKPWNDIATPGQLPAVIVWSREPLQAVGTVIPYDPS